MSNINNSNKIRRKKVSSSSSSVDIKSNRVKRPSNPSEERKLRNKTNVKPLYESKPDSKIKRKLGSFSEDKIKRTSYVKPERKNVMDSSITEKIYNNSSNIRKKNRKKIDKGTSLSGIGKVSAYIALIIVLVMAVSGITGFGYYKYINRDMPEVTKKMVQESYITKEPVSIKDMPKYLKNAIVAIEDERFYEHNGVDIQSLVRSAIHNVVYDSRQGGSTIEMQLSKNLLTSSEVSIERKLKDIHNAYGMDKVMSKEEILEAYLNNIYLGSDNYGVAAGAKFYFGKNVKDLNLAESAMLVGITNNPSIYSNYSAAKSRQKVILKKMLELKYISQNEYNEALATEVYFKSEIDR